MKLKDWADKQGIAYLTAWRWFKAGDARLANAYQSDSGTIIVPDDSDSLEQPMSATQSNDVMTTVLKKTVEFSKTNASIEEFAAWILSNFQLKTLTHSEGPRYSRVKPAPEMVQNHFKQFLKPKGDKPKPNMFVAEPEAFDDLMAKSDDLTTQELCDEIHNIGFEGGVSVNPADAPEVGDLMRDLSSAINVPVNYAGVDIKTYDNIAEGVVTRSVDLTPQQLNYTSSGDSTFGNNSFTTNQGISSNTLVSSGSSLYLAGTASPAAASAVLSVSTSSFQPTQKELQSSARVSEIADKPRRGRKPSKITGNK